MQRFHSLGAIGLVFGMLLGMAVAFAYAAEDEPASDPARYSAQYAPGMLWITDRKTNKLYIYVNKQEASVLHSTIDLSEAGKNKLVAELAPAAEQDQ